jgi:competence protein ComK
LFFVSDYIIQPQFFYLFGALDRYGKLCTIIVEEEHSFIVDKSPLQVLEDSIQYVGSDFKGSLASARKTTGRSRMTPMMVNFILNICLFPDRAYKNEYCVWINSNQIIDMKAMGQQQTVIEFSNGSSLIVNSRLTPFRAKVQLAEQYRKTNYERGKRPISFILDPKKRPLKKRELQILL